MSSYLAISGIEGDSVDDRHPHAIELDYWRFGCEQPASDAVGTGARTGRARFTDATFTCRSSSASPRLLEACATGRHFPEAVLSLDVGEGDSGPATVVRFTEVQVRGYTATGGGPGLRPTDEFRLGFAGITFSVRRQRPDGRLGDEVSTTQPAPAEAVKEPPLPTPGSGGVWRPRPPLPEH